MQRDRNIPQEDAPRFVYWHCEVCSVLRPSNEMAENGETSSSLNGKNGNYPYGRRLPAACSGEFQYFWV
jgi:hypothetical protein